MAGASPSCARPTTRASSSSSRARWRAAAAERGAVRSIEEWRQAPRAERLARLALTGDELARAIAGQDASRLARRPDPVNWASVEVLCHLRDTEESFLHRFRLILIMDGPRFPTTNPNRWALPARAVRRAMGARRCADGLAWSTHPRRLPRRDGLARSEPRRPAQPCPRRSRVAGWRRRL
ncbi:MAG: hypothetical protein DME10_16250 [Candidatus Rokuibacteriota bacterium]|nr:MAG: hypothetical protein DME10_16250 [Candidatus Rokubacteria bacterium]